MDLFHKLFPNRRKFDLKRDKNICTTSSEFTDFVDLSSWENVPKQQSCTKKPFELRQNGVRVLLYRECDRRGRKLLYDSNTVVRVPVSESSSSSAHGKAFFKGSLASSTTSSSSPLLTNKLGNSKTTSVSASKLDSFSEISDGFGYQYLKKASDSKQIGEMVFGTVALAYKGPSSKLHLLDGPPRLLLSCTSPAPRSHHSKQSSDQGIAEDSFTSSVGSLGDLLHRSMDSSSSKCLPTWPVDMPTVLNSCNSEEDSGFGGPPSPFSSTCSSLLSPPSLPNTPFGTPSSRSGSGNSLKNSGSLNSLQRRYLHNKSTSLEALLNKSTEGDSVEQDVASASYNRHNTKLGLAITIDFSEGHTQSEEDIKDWFFSKQEVIESAINKLKYSLDTAYLHSHTFVSTSYKAVVQFQKDILDLVCGYKLEHPMWLSILRSSQTKEQDILCKTLVNCLTQVLFLHDTKETNFFVSKLLTAVLTYHLGWVATVAPSQSNNLKNKHKINVPVTLTGVCEVEELNKSSPYCALWGQLCELRGAVGYPLRTARTIIVGKDKDLLYSLLTVLSYLIRCSQVVEQHVKSYDETKDHTEELKNNSDPSHHSQVNNSASIARISSAPSTLTSSSSSQASITTMVEPDQLGRQQRKSYDAAGGICFGGVSEAHEKKHKHTTEEIEPVSRWMLNDDVEIVIGSECQHTNNTSRDKEQKESIDLPEPPPNIDFKPQKLMSSKTTSNLLNLCDLDTSRFDISHDSFPKLYPDLESLDDHKDTFGPIVLEPSIIASKVHRLCRVPNKISSNITVDCAVQPSIEKWQQRGEYSSNDKHTFCDLESSIVDLPDKTSGSVYSLASLPANNNPNETVPAIDIQAEIEDGAAVLVLDKISSSSVTENVHYSHSKPSNDQDNCDNSCNVSLSNNYSNTLCNNTIVNCINENSALNTRNNFNTSSNLLKKTRSSSQSPIKCIYNTSTIRAQSDSPKCYTNVRFNDNISSQENKGPMQNNASTNNELSQCKITCIPQPTSNLRKVVKQRYVGRESNLDLTTLEKREITYPTIYDIKKETSQTFNRSFHKKAKTHKRNNSDPTHTSLYPLLVSSEEKTQLTRLQEEEVSKTSTTKDTKDSTQTHNDKQYNDSSYFKVQNMPLCMTEPDPCDKSDGKDDTVIESLMGGVLDHYSSLYVLHATTDTSQWEERLQQDLFIDAHFPVLDQSMSEAVAIVADTSSWEVEVVSSHSYVVEYRDISGCRSRGQPVGMSPLIASITDSLVHLVHLGAPPQFILQSFEDRLRELYVKSHLLSEYLLSGATRAFTGNITSASGGVSPFNLTELTRTLSLDLNDLPLLIAVASTHTPALTHMFGISVR